MTTGPNEPFSKSLFFLRYPEWKRTRAILSPSFSTAKLKLFKPLITKSLNQLIEKLESKAKNKELIDLRQYFDSFTFDVIAKTAFGLNLDVINNPDNEIFKSAKTFFQKKSSISMFLMFLFPKLSQYFNYLYYDEKSQMIISDSIKRVIKERIEGNIEIPDLLQLSINSSQLSKKDIKSSNSFESSIYLNFIINFY